MTALEDRRIIVRHIDEAHAAGARLAPVCQVVGITTRTLQHWRTEDGQVLPDGRPAARWPRLAMRRIAYLHTGEAKTDARDAAIIAEVVRSMPCTLRSLHADDEPLTEPGMSCDFDDDLSAQVFPKSSGRLLKCLSRCILWTVRFQANQSVFSKSMIYAMPIPEQTALVRYFSDLPGQ